MDLSSIEIFVTQVIHKYLNEDSFWNTYLQNLYGNKSHDFSLHLAILVEPYMQFLLEGRKTIESRFSIHACPPYEKVSPGDVIFLKKSGGPVVGLCRVTEAWFYRLDNASWSSIRKEFTESLCAQDPAFWKARRSASYATLMRLQNVRSIGPINFEKRDRRGWVILRGKSDRQFSLWKA